MANKRHLTRTDQVGGQVNEVGIVLVDEFHHGCFQQLIVELQVLSHLLQLDLFPALRHKLVNVKVILQTEKQNGKKMKREHRNIHMYI